MTVSYEQLRSTCQAPVAAGNDVAGLLFGDRASLPITKIFIDREISPNVATVGMLVFGLAGALMQFGPGVTAVAGAFCLVVYYLLDCVDGEVARWHKMEHARWGYYEYIFHFLVKPAVYLCLGFSLHAATGSLAFVVAGVMASTSTLWLKLFFGLPSIVFVGAVLRRSGSGSRPYGEYLQEAAEKARAEEQAARAAARAAGKEVDEVFRLRLDRVTFRAMLTNFDVGLLLLFMASLLDTLVDPLQLDALGFPLPWRGVWLLWYGAILPLDFFDYLRTYFRQGHFDRQMVRLIARAHGFAIESDRREPTAAED